jgi:hypothetical protein
LRARWGEGDPIQQIDQPGTNQQTNQPINQPSNQPTNHQTNQPPNTCVLLVFFVVVVKVYDRAGKQATDQTNQITRTAFKGFKAFKAFMITSLINSLYKLC